MELTLNTRLTIAFVVGIAGLVWQGVIVTLGGEADPVLISAFSSILLATIGIGTKAENGKSKEDAENKQA